MSQTRLDELIEERKMRTAETRKEVALALEYAKSLGDLSENFEYHDAKDRQASNEMRILELESLIKNAVLIEEQQGGSEIDLGVTFIAERGEKMVTLQMVGSNEADPLEGKISNESPMGQAFIGARVGQTVSVQTPAGAVEYLVTQIK